MCIYNYYTMKEVKIIFRHNVDETTEKDETPYCANNYLPHEKYHSFLKGCECEMKITRSDNHNISVHKYCKTHGVMCSKTGWELGWYQGTNSRNIERNVNLGFMKAQMIRQLHSEGWSLQRLVAKFQTNQTSIYRILANKIFVKPIK